MNERIKKLAIEAKLRPALLLQMFGKIDALCDSELKELANVEKFAELIVRECALQCIHNEDMDLIEKHFGVDK